MAFNSSNLQELLFRKVLVLAKIESSYNVDAGPSPASDALLVSDVDFRIDPNVLERAVFRPSISPAEVAIGRKLATVTMTHELKASGTIGVAPAIGKLLRACGFAQTTVANTAAATIGLPVVRSGASSPAQGATFARGTNPSTKTGRYVLTCVKGGASATAKFRVTGTPATPDESVLASEEFSASNLTSGGTSTVTVGRTSANDNTSITYTIGGTFAAGQKLRLTVGGIRFEYTTISGNTDNAGLATALAALLDAHPLLAASASTNVITVTFPNNSATAKAEAVTVTSGTTEIPIGDTGATIIPTWTGSVAFGDTWDIQVLEQGVHYTPVSGNFDSLTMYIYMDGILHKMTGSRGTVTFTGEAGNYGSAQFAFTGQYVPVEDAVIPTGTVYESTIPEQIENALFALNSFDDFCAQSFNIDMQNQVVPRDCLNNADGFNGVTITERSPQGTINPEATLQIKFPLWGLHAAATKVSYHLLVGKNAGNRWRFISDSAQIAGVTYGDRNQIRVTDINLRFSQFSGDGNDEIRLIAC